MAKPVRFAKYPTSFICLRVEEGHAILVAVVLREDPRHMVEVTVPSHGRFKVAQRYGMGYFPDAKAKLLQSAFDNKYRAMGITWGNR